MKCLAAGFLILGMCCAAVAESPRHLSKDLAELTGMLEGFWDNDRQVFFAQEAGYPTDEVAPRQSVRLEAIELEGLPDGTIALAALREVKGEGPDSLVHLFSIAPEDGDILHSFHIPTDDAPPLHVRDLTGIKLSW